jgi:hypothetical protein
MKLTFQPLEAWLTPEHDWAPGDSRAFYRARQQGWITETMADRLLLRYANIQLELVHPDVTA